MSSTPSSDSAKPAHIYHLDDIPYLHGKFGQSKILVGTGILVIWGEVNAGLETPRHNHINEQVTWILEGSVDYQVDDGPVTTCGPGTVIHIPPMVWHQSWYREPCKLLELFNPPRYDLHPGAATHIHGVVSP
jgi:mannose-6-phosphate isomerase-like protein (cupin superfamily)